MQKKLTIQLSQISLWITLQKGVGITLHWSAWWESRRPRDALYNILYIILYYMVH